jgi:hypothetical protein
MKMAGHNNHNENLKARYTSSSKILDADTRKYIPKDFFQ